MEKLSKYRLSCLIDNWSRKGAFMVNAIKYGHEEEILACLLELKQLRAEKQQSVAKSTHHSPETPQGFQLK